jgi:glutamate-ammonia-ligase adenylyltransferase
MRSPRRVTRNAGNIALLKLAARLGLISVESAEAVADAYRDYRRRQHWLRLNGAKYARVSAEQVRNRIDATRFLWARVFGTD